MVGHLFNTIEPVTLSYSYILLDSCASCSNLDAFIPEIFTEVGFPNLIPVIYIVVVADGSQLFLVQ